MIKILFLIEHLKMGGAENVLCHLVNSLDPAKFDITVQTIWPNDSVQRFREGIRYRACYPVRNRWTELQMRAETAAGLTYPLRIRDDYDIECAFLEYAPTKVLAASTNHRAKKLAWVHCDLKKGSGNIEEQVRKCAPWYQKYEKVICVSEDVRKSYVELYGNQPEAMVLHNVVNDEAIRERAKHSLPEGITPRRKTVVSVGRLEAQKNYAGLLRVHKRLMDAGFAYDLWILGKGAERPQLEELIRLNHLQDSLKLFGYVENPYPFLREADFLVCSSLYEGFSTFVTEAMILGKTVVTTDCTGMKELLGDSEYGLIVPNDEDSLYEGMVRMLSDPELCAYYEKQAMRRGMDFSTESLAKKAEELFVSLME